jgi:hypothetical protein
MYLSIYIISMWDVRRLFSKRWAETVSLIHCCGLHSGLLEWTSLFFNHAWCASYGFQTTRYFSWVWSSGAQSRLFHLGVSTWPCFFVGLVGTVVRYFRVSWCVDHCYRCYRDQKGNLMCVLATDTLLQGKWILLLNRAGKWPIKRKLTTNAALWVIPTRYQQCQQTN